MRSRFPKPALDHSLVYLSAILLVFIILTPSFLSAYQLNQLQTSPSFIDLNEMMLKAWKDWDALLTRWFSLNGTLVDLYDFARRSNSDPSNTTLSGIGFYTLALTSMYEQTLDNYYLSKLRAIVEGLMSNPSSYSVYVPGIGYIFYIPTYYYNGYERDSNPALTMVTAFASVKLWKWTQNPKFKQLADRVARESLRLATVNNSTDLAWSRGYYQDKDEVIAAKQEIARQAPITLFYTLYGKEINPTYLSYINRTLHWQFQAQLPSGGLANGIGETTEHRANTGIYIFALTWGYRISPKPYLNYTPNIAKAILWLRFLPIDFEYMENYAVTGALINAWKANFTVDITQIQTAAYLGLRAFNFTTYGVFPKATATAYGWRWPQVFTSCFLSTYPLPDGTYQLSQISQLIDYSSYSATDKDIEYNWITDQGFDRFRINSRWGSGVYQWRETARPLYFFFGGGEDVPTSTVENNRYYLNVRYVYLQSAVEQQIYVSGLVIWQVTGTETFSIHQEFQDQIDISLTNGTNLVLNNLTNSTVNLDTTMIIRQHTNPAHFFFIMSPSATWTAYNQTGVLQLRTTVTNGKLLLARLQIANLSVSEAFDLFNYYAPYVNQSVPIAFTDTVDSYTQLKNHVGIQKYGIPSWKVAYVNATRGEEEKVKLMALSLPENVYVSYWNFTAQNLTAMVSGIIGVNSALKIYSGYRFSPLKVFINDTEQTKGTVWSFDSSTRTFSVNVTFSLSASLKLDVFFSQDKTPPDILSVIRSIENPEYNDTVTVSANITDDDSGVGTVLLSYLNGTYWLNTTMTLNLNTSLYEGQIPPLPYATEVQYKVYAADRAENWRVRVETYYSYRVTDTYPPVVAILVEHLLPNRTTILRPAEGDYVSNNATITVYCEEPNLAKMELYIDEAFVKLWNDNNTQSYKWDTTALPDSSSHILRMIASDLAGNSASTTATVFPDNTPPLIGTANWIPGNPTPSENVTVTVSVTDATSGVESANILYRLAGAGTTQMTQMTFKDGSWSGIIPGQPDDTTVLFAIEAFDRAGNRAQTQPFYSYHVGYSALPIFILVVMAGISIGIISAGVFVYYRKRRKSKNDKLTPEQVNIKTM